MTRRHEGRAASATRHAARPRLEPRDIDPDPAGWATLPQRAPRYCPICLARLDELAYVDWCPSCQKTLRLALP